MVLHQRPGVVVQAVVLVDQELADVSGRHVGGNLHHFSRPILAPHLHYLETHEESGWKMKEVGWGGGVAWWGGGKVRVYLHNQVLLSRHSDL